MSIKTQYPQFYDLSAKMVFPLTCNHTSMVKFMNLLTVLSEFTMHSWDNLPDAALHTYIYIYICIIYIYIYTHVDIHTHIHPPMLHIVIPCSIGGAFTLRWLPAARLDCRPCAKLLGETNWSSPWTSVDHVEKNTSIPILNSWEGLDMSWAANGLCEYHENTWKIHENFMKIHENHGHE